MEECDIEACDIGSLEFGVCDVKRGITGQDLRGFKYQWKARS